MLFNYRYWRSQGGDFFRWLAARRPDPDGADSNGHDQSSRRVAAPLEP